MTQRYFSDAVLKLVDDLVIWEMPQNIFIDSLNYLYKYNLDEMYSNNLRMITFALNTEYYIDTDPKFLWSILADEDIDSNSTYGIPSDSADIDIYNINSYINTTDDTVTSLRFVQPNKGPLQVYEIHGSYIIYRGSMRHSPIKLIAINFKMFNNNISSIPLSRPNVNVIIQNCGRNERSHGLVNFKSYFGKTLYIEKRDVFRYVLFNGVYNLIVSKGNSKIFMKNLPLFSYYSIFNPSTRFIDITYTSILYYSGSASSYNLSMFEIPLEDMKLALNYWDNFYISSTAKVILTPKKI
ncbi:uncharacterized protein LOC135928158 [Gordionus sp. m RMFG-2023]|uniref:uncharacterized protein LOC135928158 n=1 Tax=Gordionus sp. m RMFG-2023 TaxID=3053472 RepID=UPI0031FC6E64